MHYLVIAHEMLTTYQTVVVVSRQTSHISFPLTASTQHKPIPPAHVYTIPCQVNVRKMVCYSACKFAISMPSQGLILSDIAGDCNHLRTHRLSDTIPLLFERIDSILFER